LKAKYDDSDEEDFENNEGDEPLPKISASAKKTTSSNCPGRSYNDRGTKSQAPSKPATSSTQTAHTTAKKPKYKYNDDLLVEEIDDSNIKETPRPTVLGKKIVASTRMAKPQAPYTTQSTLTSFASTLKPPASLRGISRVAQILDSDSDGELSKGGGGWGSSSQSTTGQSC
jgi:hypothetical protein